jgi:hypothetical protein
MGRKIKDREEYKLKFDTLMNEKMNWIPQQDKGIGEKIIQCKEGYPPYWFISNMGYILSVWNNEIKIVKLNFRWVGLKNKDGVRNGRDWYINSKFNKIGNISLQRLIAEHFLENEFGGDPKEQVHHIHKRLDFDENQGQFANRVSNLQILPLKIHRELTKIATKTDTQNTEEIDKKMKKAGAPTYGMTEQELERFILYALMNCTEQPTIYITTLEDEAKNIEAEAHKIKKVTVTND